MRTISLLLLALSFGAHHAPAASFNPAVLTISAPPVVWYKFDGARFEIPYVLGGTDACVTMSIFTRARSELVRGVRNGYLGWHYVDRIDTCLFVSEPLQSRIGSNTVSWDGLDESGRPAPMGEYAYYLWAYDNVNPRIPVARSLPFNWEDRGIVVTHDTGGNPLTNPVIYSSTSDHGASAAQREHIRMKWIIGSDPEDDSLVQTCAYMSWSDNGSIALQPDDHRMFFVHTLTADRTAVVRKYRWTPNGDAVAQYEWGEDGEFRYSVSNPPGWYYFTGVVSDGAETLFLTRADISGGSDVSQIILIDAVTGTEDRRIELSDWWVDIRDYESGAQLVGGPTDLEYRNGFLAASSHTSCVHQLIDPWAEKGEEVRYSNRNGDYIGDRNFEPNSPRPWACHDDKTGPYCYNTTLDANLFAIFPSYDIGAVSFGLLAPDGTGIGYFSFAGETAAAKWGEHCVDYGSAYDGLYTNHTASGDTKPSWHYVAQDSFKGVISTWHHVQEDASGPRPAITVRNAPNPFNPATSVMISLEKAGRVTVDVFDIAGRRVATLLNGPLKAGNHTLVWNAARQAAGVYFCTVASGAQSRTVKMTLVK